MNLPLCNNSISERDMIRSIPRHPQVQWALNDQLRVLAAAANRLGLYDAADLVRNTLNRQQHSFRGEKK